MDGHPKSFVFLLIGQGNSNNQTLIFSFYISVSFLLVIPLINFEMKSVHFKVGARQNISLLWYILLSENVLTVILSELWKSKTNNIYYQIDDLLEGHM